MFRQPQILQLLLLGTATIFVAYIAIGTTHWSKFAEAGGENPEDVSISDEPELEQTGVVEDNRLGEISGIDSSFRYQDCYWVHNDSGNPAEIFLISETGKTRAVVSLKGATNFDWEDICLFNFRGKPHICIADVGDNGAKRNSYQLYILAEPEFELPSADESALSISIENFKRFEFTYPDGPRNCEAIAVHPSIGDFYLFQKSKDRNSKEEEIGIYKLRLKKNFELMSKKAKKIGNIGDRLVTGAAISRDSCFLVYCNYAFGGKMRRTPAFNWDRQLSTGTFQAMATPVQRQAEAICFSPDGKHLVFVSEKTKQPIWKMTFPKSNSKP